MCLYLLCGWLLASNSGITCTFDGADMCLCPLNVSLSLKCVSVPSMRLHLMRGWRFASSFGMTCTFGGASMCLCLLHVWGGFDQ